MTPGRSGGEKLNFCLGNERGKTGETVFPSPLATIPPGRRPRATSRRLALIYTRAAGLSTPARFRSQGHPRGAAGGRKDSLVEDQSNTHIWTAEAVRSAKEWAGIRVMARRVLDNPWLDSLRGSARTNCTPSKEKLATSLDTIGHAQARSRL